MAAGYHNTVLTWKSVTFLYTISVLPYLQKTGDGQCRVVVAGGHGLAVACGLVSKRRGLVGAGCGLAVAGLQRGLISRRRRLVVAGRCDVDLANNRP